MPDAPVSPYLLCRDAAAELDWIAKTLGFTERARMEDPEGRVSHAEVEVGESVIMVGQPKGTYRNPRDLGAATVLIHVHVADVDALFHRAVEGGAEIVQQLEDQPYGDRNAAIRDPEGHEWYIATTIGGEGAQLLEPLQQFDQVVAEVQEIVDAVTPEHLDRATPCAQWNVRQVINHMVTGNLAFAAIVGGEALPDRDADRVGDAPTTAFADAAGSLRAALADEGVMERAYSSAIGEVPGSTLLQMRVTEMIVHGWDVAQATGQPTNIAPEIAGAALGVWQGRLLKMPDGRGDLFGPEQPVASDANPADRLAAFLGRQVS